VTNIFLFKSGASCTELNANNGDTTALEQQGLILKPVYYLYLINNCSVFI